MLKFTTTAPFDINTPMEVLVNTKPLIKIKDNCSLIGGNIKGNDAVIIGEALKLAEFSLPCFYEGNLSELDKVEQDIRMVLPSGEYPVRAFLSEDGVYYLELKNI